MPVSTQESAFFTLKVKDLSDPTRINGILRFIIGELSKVEDRLDISVQPTAAGAQQVITVAGGGGGGGGTGSPSYVTEYTLTDPTTLITTAILPASGDQMTVVITQDATGGRQITWDTMFKMATVEIDTTADTISIFSFIGLSDTNWYCTGIPMTGGVP